MIAALALVVANAQVLTLSAAQPRATTVAAVDGRIVYVGDNLPAAKKAAGPEAQVIDAGGRVVIPGFNDAHAHFGLSLTLGSDHGIDLPELSRRAFLKAAQRAAHALADRDGWLFIKTPYLPEGIRRAAHLDSLDRPVLVVTRRGGLLNHRGLRAAHLGPDEAPDGFVRGRALPAALDRVVKHLSPRRLEAGARAFLSRLARLGITSVQLIDELPELFERLRLQGALSARVRMIALGYRFGTRLYEPDWKAPAPEWVRVDGVKYFHDDFARITRFELAELLERNTSAGRRVVVHVLSRRALESLITALERFGRGKPETTALVRIDHADEVTPEQAARLERLGVIVCSNPSMLPEWRSARAFPMRTLTRSGVRTCIGSDWVGAHVPARLLEPFVSMELAVTHGGYGEAERLAPLEALEAFTVGAAAAEGWEDQKGQLQPGRLADLLVLSADPTAIPPEQLHTLRPLLTVVGGRVVYRAPGFGVPVAKLPPPPTIGPPAAPPPPTIGPPPAPRERKRR